ncbi:hypothetical protein SAMN05421788_108225 [Filimonas lacunae]|uniref:Lipoprotein n=1 Tax=Filimonas lacunae TaxID=477680 RepID=A0A173MDM6_9BACT|nr:hypothetical protein [Filimonas lacunae]BAV05630.1 hypothetical protein FLA_1641 [Filimonas lacunae]SIT29131.1 hypothetical protein SAMN05421788_108225 [Filimonas lacunae]
MKSNFFVLGFAICVLAACNNSNGSGGNGAISTGGDSVPGISNVLMTWDDARTDINRYDSICRYYFKDSIPIRYFTIRSQDLLASMGMDVTIIDSLVLRMHPFVRLNIGMDTLPGNKFTFKAFLQPVDSVCAQYPAGIGRFFNKEGFIVNRHGGRAGVPVSQDGSITLYVADLNTPCPNTCEKPTE